MERGDDIQFNDRPDDAGLQEAARIWVRAEEARSSRVMSESYLDDQRHGFMATAGRLDAWLTVAVEKGQAIGCVGGFLAEDDAELGTMYLAYLAVDPRLWGDGIGRRLVTHAETRALLMGTARMTLTVHDDNFRARRLYEHLGWNLTGRTERTPVNDELLLEYRHSL